jgi:hypothetical protein
MPKKIVRDYRSMTIDELRATAREARERERSARYAKGRRGWKSFGQAAEAELARRENGIRRAGGRLGHCSRTFHEADPSNAQQLILPP